MDITSRDAPAARLLDLTRLVRRAGRPFTGVDRVEFAYLDHLLTLETPLFGLVRSAFGFILLDRAGCAALHTSLINTKFGPPDLLSRLKSGLHPDRARAEADLRRLCRARCLPIRLGQMLRMHLPARTHYINVGHSNLTARVISAVQALTDSRIAVMVHDTIPLDHPDYQRPETTAAFKGFLDRAVAVADVILCNSEQTKTDVLRHAATHQPRCLVSHLGIPPPQPGPPPTGPWDGHPYFMCIGTIEPRKNHALLLDVWPRIPDAHLILCGGRGWRNEAVFARLDAHPDRIHERPGLDDAAMFGLLKHSNGLLFPSHSEGYGLPPIEAAALGVPILCNDLPIYREVLGNIPVYATSADSYLWAQEITRMATSDPANIGSTTDHANGWKPPTWDAHFKTVLTMI
ncbi:glycosyltransferase family 4 protein [Primorskyibacter sp. 2E107]|uniref:glycosyltransferase family 4 protein n=1 Tax=Primorskyibacter sp. 2E107 TaxID=3403458 RepID=UPI003AF41E31